MHVYAADNNDAIPGGPHTTSAFLYRDRFHEFLDLKYSNDYCPEIVTNLDWASPLARSLGVSLERGGTWPQRFKRYRQISEAKIFRCPSNERIASPYTESQPFEPCLMNSYNTAMAFHFLPAEHDGVYGLHATHARPEWSCPAYSPKVSKIGDAWREIFIADGGRRNGFPVVVMSFKYNDDELSAGPFSDPGPIFTYTGSWSRWCVPGNGLAADQLFFTKQGIDPAASPIDMAHRARLGR